MNWSPQQADALDAVGRWLRDPSMQVFRLFGFAGTGKTTLARHLGDSHGGLVHYASFTGKAALVLRKKGCAEATTIHSFLYTPSPKSRERLRELEAEHATLTPDARKSDGGIDFGKMLQPGTPEYDKWTVLDNEIAAERERLRQPAFAMRLDPLLTKRGRVELIVIDEVSMVDSRLGQDLLSTGAKVLVLGDPAQLPPVSGGGFFTNAEPDVLLTEVHRQALDSPVLALATRVREGERLEDGAYGESRVCPRAVLDPEDYANVEQLLVGFNATRRGANKRLRGMAGFSGVLPQPGERLVCLRNDHSPAKRLLNGSLWTVVEAADAPNRDEFPLMVESLDEALPNGDGRRVEALCHKYTFMETPQPEFDSLRYCGCDRDGIERPECAMRCAGSLVNEFDFGYALTVHKAQGSQWNSVAIIDEWNMADKKRWLYTAITRAAERVTVAR